MKTKLLMLSVAMSCALSSAAFAMDKVEYKAQKDAVAALGLPTESQAARS